MGNDNIVWIGMDTDAKKNQVALYRGWETQPAAEWEAGMDEKGIKRLIERLKREAGNLGRLYRAGELTVIGVPDEKQEALRDLTRAREDVREDLTRRQHRLNRFLARQGCHYQDGEKWTQKHWAWIRKIRLEDSNAETVREESIRAVEQSQEQLKTYDAKIEENAGKPEYAKKVERYKTLRALKPVTGMTSVAEA